MGDIPKYISVVSEHLAVYPQFCRTMAKTVPNEVTERFAKRLRATRIGRGFKTARLFARNLGIHENRYTRYERAEVEPDLATFNSICTALEITPNDLLCETIGLSSDGPAPGLAPGFTEDRMTAIAGQSSGEWSPSPQARFKGEAMALAMELGAILAKKEVGGGEPAPFEAIQAASGIFQRIVAAPFDFLSGIGHKIDIASADLEAQARVARHIRQIVEHLRGPARD